MTRVSIHAPAWGATKLIGQAKAGNLCFNPRPRVGGDGTGRGDQDPPRRVSIHAPAWGATSPGETGSWPGSSFNPRPRVGGDVPDVRYSGEPMLFQSTPPRGGRLLPRAPVLAASSFNPRPRVGGDAGFARPQSKDRKFQSTPPRGGRLDVALEVIGQLAVSIHAPAWGATGSHHGSDPGSSSFNPRPRVGGDWAARPY